MVGPSILVKHAGSCNTLWEKPSQKNSQAVQLVRCTWSLPLFFVLFHLIENLSCAFWSHVKKPGWFEIVQRDWWFLGSFQYKLNNWLGVMDCSVTQKNSLLQREPVLTGLSGGVFRKKASNYKRRVPRRKAKQKTLNVIHLLQKESLFHCERRKWVKQLGRDTALSKFSSRDYIGVSSAACIPSDFPEAVSVWAAVMLFMSLRSV